MDRYLLFDSGCSTCEAIARDVEEATFSKLKTLSLRNPDVQAQLEMIRPNWNWEPMLLEIDGERGRVYSGFAMKLRIVALCGPIRAWRLAQVARQRGVGTIGFTRRGVIRRVSVMMAAMPFVRHDARRQKASFLDQILDSRIPVIGDIWGGFVLLPTGSPVPHYVTEDKNGVPSMCGAGEGRGGASASAIIETLNPWLDLDNQTATPAMGVDGLRQLVKTMTNIAASVGAPLYLPNSQLSEMSPMTITIIRHESGEPFLTSMSLHHKAALEGSFTTDAYIMTQLSYPQPYPIWHEEILDDDRPKAETVKTMCRGLHGVLVLGPESSALHWIEGDTLNKLVVNSPIGSAEMLEIAASLQVVRWGDRTHDQEGD